MNSLFQSMKELAGSVPFRLGAMMLIAMTSLIVVNVRSAVTLPPTVTLSPDPLYSKGLRAKPTLTLALSVEFPTVGAQYLSGVTNATEDATYSPSNQYVGYFDSESCYRYNNNASAGLRRFDRSGAATNHACGGTGFSGNFMNWASSSAIDVLRFGLTGGDRVVDTNVLTVLQRAILPNTNVSNNFWNGSNFPSKRLISSLAAGAVPTALLAAYTGDVYVANCLNRIHFGTAPTGSCASPGANSNLGVSASVSNGPTTGYSGLLAAAPPLLNLFSLTPCATENGTCTFTGIKQVAYGAGTNWIFVSANNGVLCANSVFGDPAVGTAKACYTRNDPTNWTPPTNAGVLSQDSFFYSRVSVCDVDSNGALTDPRTDLCQKYPAGNYKPVGNLQRYSDNIRVSAFSYLNDSTGDPNQRYGGVLRAPMKYVGAKSFDQNFIQSSTANPQQEWDTQTGIFVQNPDAATVGYSATVSGADSNWPGLPISGVTNYLNQFGRTGPALGAYKTYDPIGELYYEALRYIQGLPPTPAATSGMTAAMQDGYPVYTTWVDPHPTVAGLTTYKCVKNNILAIGDVNTWNDKSFPGNPAARATNGDTARAINNANNEPDYHYWTQVVGSFEANGGLAYLDGSGTSRTATNFNPPNSNLSGIADQNIGAEAASYYMAGAAYWANTHDIRGTNWTSQPLLQRPGMRATTFMLDVNEAGAESNYSTRAASQFFLAAKYGGFTDTTLTGNPFLATSTGSRSVVDSNANWSKPSLTTNPAQLEAQNYYLSSSASAVLTALNNIFAAIAKGANSIAGAAISTQTLTSASTGYTYQARFDPNNYWSGDLIPFQISSSGNSVSVAAESSAPWHAAAVLDARSLVTAPRKIVIGAQGTTPSPTALPFSWTSLDATTQSLIKQVGDTDAVGQARVEFLSGDRVNEGKTMRLRGSRLGDIANSGIVLSGAPSTAINDASYTQFATDNAARSTTLFVGANDGMLHAFSAATGSEIFGYIPSWLAPKIGLLSTPSYVHQSYVDATPTVAEAYVGTAWKTVLVGGTGGGGQGVYALDVTSPSSFDSTKVLWEFTDKHDASLGNVVGKPQILKLRTNTVPGTATYKYFAVVASGVNNYAVDGNASTTGYPAIFILDLAKATGTPWTLNTNYWKVELPRAASTSAQGMVTFTAMTGTFGEVTFMYAGDLQGNLWKLDFTSLGSASWNATSLSYYKSNGTPIPMFTALDASGNAQPITMAPYPVPGRYNSTVIAFGTGKYLETSDISGTYGTQSFYALYDNNKAAWALDNTTDAIAGRGRLSPDTLVNGQPSGPIFIWGRPTADDDLTVRAGWYLDLPASSSGERQISDFIAAGGTLFANSVIPAPSTCDDGSGNAYALNVFSGGGTYTTSTVGLQASPLVVQVPSGDSTYIGGADGTRGRNRYRTSVEIIPGSAGIGVGATTVVRIQGGRLSWRELNNSNLDLR